MNQTAKQLAIFGLNGRPFGYVANLFLLVAMVAGSEIGALDVLLGVKQLLPILLNGFKMVKRMLTVNNFGNQVEYKRAMDAVTSPVCRKEAVFKIFDGGMQIHFFIQSKFFYQLFSSF